VTKKPDDFQVPGSALSDGFVQSKNRAKPAVAGHKAKKRFKVVTVALIWPSGFNRLGRGHLSKESTFYPVFKKK
jgi:hypothetical protein